MDKFDIRKYITENKINEQEGSERRYLVTFKDGTDEEVGKHISVSPEDAMGSLRRSFKRQGKSVNDVKHLGVKPVGIYEGDMGDAVEFYMNHYDETEMSQEIRDAIEDALDSGKPLKWVKDQIKDGFLDMILPEGKVQDRIDSLVAYYEAETGNEADENVEYEIEYMVTRGKFDDQIKANVLKEHQGFDENKFIDWALGEGFSPKMIDSMIDMIVSGVDPEKLKKDLLDGTINEVIDAFGDVTKKTLKSKSAQSLKDMLGGKSFMQAAQDSMQMLPQLMDIEKPYRDQLDVLAKEIVYRMFPIIEQAGIQVDAKLVDSPNEMKITKQGKEEEAEPDDLDAVADKAGIDKRRIINSITQGAGIRGTKAYYMFDEVLNSLDPELISKYDQLVGDSYGIYDDDNAIAMMMAMLSQGQGTQSGESEVEWNDEDDTMTIKARALTFPILLQEIVKGLYEFVSLQGFSDDAEKNKQIVQKVDKVTNEPEDIRYGKFIYDALRDLASDLDIENEMFFKEVYQLPEADFKIFIENVLNDQLTSDQKRWVEETPNRLEQEEDE